MQKETVTLYGFGDTSPMHEPIKPYSELILPALAEADLRFCSAERPYGEDGVPQLNSGATGKPLHPRFASIFDDLGMDVVSIASNHMMDWGAEVMLETRSLLESKGITVIGAGRNLEEACRAEIVERNGVKVAFLSFCSNLREGHEAGPSRPGVAPLRASTYYEAPNYQPGVPARVISIPNAEDMDRMLKGIADAKTRADIVVLSLHWGVGFVPRLVADYQVEVARRATEAGADIILGHHAHSLRAIASYGGRACFYSLGNFIITSNYLGGDPAKYAAFEKEMGTKIDPNYPLLPYGVDAMKSVGAKAVLSKKGVERVSFLPVLIDTKGRAAILTKDHPRFSEMVDFAEWVSEGFPHAFSVEGSEVVVK